MGQPESLVRWQYGQYTVFETDRMEEIFGKERMAKALSNADMMDAFSGFLAASMQGYAIIDTSATKPMSGIDLLLYCQDILQQQTRKDVILGDLKATTRFTYANGANDESFGRVGIPHRCGLPSHDHCIWFTAVPTKSPTLLGLDWMHSAQASLNALTGVLHFADGSVEPCKKLPTGHWALALLE